MDAISTGEPPPSSPVNEITCRQLCNNDIMKWMVLAVLFIVCSTIAMSQTASVLSPNQKIAIALYKQKSTDAGE